MATRAQTAQQVVQRVIALGSSLTVDSARDLALDLSGTAVPSPRWDAPGTDPGGGEDETLALLLPLLILLTTLLFLLLLFLLFLILLRRQRGGISLRDDGGPTNLAGEDELEGEGGLAGIEQRWLEGAEESVRIGYLRSKVWQTQYPPNSHPTDITLSQFLSIQEKGVSAWSFEPDYESNASLIVQSRTEITFLADGVGMAEEEGGGCCVQSNLPLPKLNEVYYWESKIYEKAPGCTIAIGLATKPFPSFRLPGWSKYSVGYFSSDGFKSHSYPFTSQSYGPPLTTGDVLGVGYRPRTGTVFFTRNGRKLEDAFIGLNKHNLFPTVGANGACSVHVNFGQAGFVFIEANVKKWGLAPMMGTLAPPPAYGSERGSILLETAGAGSSAPSPPPVISETRPSTSAQRGGPQSRHRNRRPVVAALASNSAGAVSALSSPSQPIRPSPLRHSRQASTQSSYSSLSNRGDDSEGHGGEAENPPTPGLGAISLHSIHRFPTLERSDEEDEDTPSPSSGSPRRGTSDSGSDSGGEDHALIPAAPVEASVRNVSRSPPAYHPIDPHRYAPGVAELLLEDAFAATPNSRQFGPNLSLLSQPHPRFSSVPGTPNSGSGSPAGSSAFSTGSGTAYEARTEGEGASWWSRWGFGLAGIPPSAEEEGRAVAPPAGARQAGGTR